LPTNPGQRFEAVDYDRREPDEPLAVRPSCGSNVTDPSGRVAAMASKAADVMAMRITTLLP
jgi:hypothetical protein